MYVSTQKKSIKEYIQTVNSDCFLRRFERTAEEL